jgi:hypothetical protein
VITEETVLDNIAHILGMYQPVSFELFKNYIANGFELEELILKRQRHCSTAPLGTYLCTLHDFLMFTHEFVAVFRKVPKEEHSIFSFEPMQHNIQASLSFRKVPYCPIVRSSVVMGTIWSFSIQNEDSLSRLASCKILERFGKNDSSWVFVNLQEFEKELLTRLKFTNQCSNAEILESINEDEEVVCDYEQKRMQRILENKRQLLQLGLTCDLVNENQDDSKYSETAFSFPEIEPSSPSNVSIYIIPHLDIPNAGIFSDGDWIMKYRNFVVEKALEASSLLQPGGLFVAGVKDVRIEDPLINFQTRFVPLSVLICEDLQKLSNYCMKEYMIYQSIIGTSQLCPKD